MRIALGIDTGGTYTDAVLVDHQTGQVLADAKALTTRHDLSVGIRQAMEAVFAAAGNAGLSPSDVVLVGLSTTLATNAMVEGQGGRVCLLLIGYDQQLMERYGFQNELSTEDYVYIAGGHDEAGDEAQPLDEAALLAAVEARRRAVEAFAVSAYFSVRNPAHEQRARALIQQYSGLPVTCGHELSSSLNAVRRATTAALNARLIGALHDLILTVQKTLDELGIAAPLMVVKGDGSLVRAEWAMERPIETILSGPAASVVGAWHLAQAGGSQEALSDAWVVDVGGTTTDIAALRGGFPTINSDGASLGGWRTMVQAIDVRTTGLGGDSHIRWGAEGRLLIGPRRVVPLSLLAATYPQVLRELRSLGGGYGRGSQPANPEFILAGRPAENITLDEAEQEILRGLSAGPQPSAQLSGRPRATRLERGCIEDLTRRGLVQHAAFTPTDALHVLGRLNLWDIEAARLAAGVLAAQAGLSVEEFCAQVLEAMVDRLATELLSKALEDDLGRPVEWEHDSLAKALLERALRGNGAGEPGCSLTLRRPIVAIGAPVGAYMPQVADKLQTGLFMPPHAHVANAVGAVAGGVIQRIQVSANMLSDQPGGECLRVFMPQGYRDFRDLEEAMTETQRLMVPYAERLAHEAGADQVEVQVTRRDQWVSVPGTNGHGAGGSGVYLGSELVFTAAGRPALVWSDDNGSGPRSRGM